MSAPTLDDGIGTTDDLVRVPDIMWSTVNAQIAAATSWAVILESAPVREAILLRSTSLNRNSAEAFPTRIDLASSSLWLDPAQRHPAMPSPKADARPEDRHAVVRLRPLDSPAGALYK